MSKPSLKDRLSKVSSNEGDLEEVIQGPEEGIRGKLKEDQKKVFMGKLKEDQKKVFMGKPEKTQIIPVPAYPNRKYKTKADQESKIKKIKILYDMLKKEQEYSKFFSQPKREEFNKSNLQALRKFIQTDIFHRPLPKRGLSDLKISIEVSEDFKKELDRRVNENKKIEEKVEQEVPEGGIQESPEGGFQGGFQEGIQESPEEGFQEGASQEGGSQEGGSEEVPESPKQNMIVQQQLKRRVLYDNAQKALAKVGIETPLDELGLPLDLKERFLANPDDSIDDVIREASKNYAINVYRQRYKDIEDNSFRSFLQDAINEGLINPYKYFDKNREERVMYLFGDKAMTEPELREEFNKYRFKNLIKGSKNKLHEAAERAIMKKREKQLEAYKEMKQTTHDEIRPKMVLNPMLFNHA